MGRGAEHSPRKPPVSTPPESDENLKADGQEVMRSGERSLSDDEKGDAKRAGSSDEIEKVAPRVNPPRHAKDAASSKIAGKVGRTVKEDDTDEPVARTLKKRQVRKQKKGSQAKKTGASKAKTKAKRA